MSILNRARFVVVAASLLAGVASADDPHLEKWLAAGKGITAVEATFVVKRWRPETRTLNFPPPRYHICYDLATGRWQATVEGMATRVLDDGTRKAVRHVGHYGVAGGISWDGSQNENGSNYFQIAVRGQKGNGIGSNPLVSNAGYGKLERCLFAPHALQLRGALDHGIPLQEIQEALTLQSDKPSKATPGARELVYIAKHGKQTGTIRHRVDFSDGVRGYETTAMIDGKVAEKTTCTDFKKIDGRWIAMKTIQYTANPWEKVYKQTGGSTVVIKEIKLNKSCDPDNIYFPVAIGDQVRFTPGEPSVLVEDMVEFHARFKAFVAENAVAEEKEGEAAAKPAPAPKK